MTPPKRRRKRGVHRPSKLTDEVFNSVKQALNLGAFRKTAALWAGISYTVFREWMRYGRDRPRSEYAKFRRMVLREESTAEVVVGGVLLKAAREHPKYAKAWLELRHRKRWKPSQQLEHTGKDGGPIEVTDVSLEGYTDDELEALESIHRRARARLGGDSAGEGPTES